MSSIPTTLTSSGTRRPRSDGEHVEVVRRGGLTFVINHGADDAELRIEGTDVLTGAAASGLQLPSQGVAIVEP